MADEKQTQNSEVQVLAYTPRVARAIEAILAPVGYASKISDRKRGRSSLTDNIVAGGNVAAYTGPFSFTFNSETGKLIVGAGFLNRNGDFLEVEQTEITPEEGYICCQCNLKASDDGKRKEWETPAIVVLDKPSALAYPLGRCTKQEDNGSSENNSNGETLPQEPQWLFECYEVEMAFIIATRQCPLAGGGGK